MMDAFQRAAAKPEGSTGNDFIEAIRHERPDLAGQMAYAPSQGQFAHTVFIGEEVFKGPKLAELADDIDRECANLKSLAGKGLPVAEITCAGKETVFFGMKRMPGVTLEGAGMLTGQQIRQLADDIADFMIRMAKALPEQDGKFAIHADLNEGNILIDPLTRRLSAVIDFGMIDHVPKHEVGPRLMKNAALSTMIWQAISARRDEIGAPAASLAAASPVSKLIIPASFRR